MATQFSEAARTLAGDARLSCSYLYRAVIVTDIVRISYRYRNGHRTGYRTDVRRTYGGCTADVRQNTVRISYRHRTDIVRISRNPSLCWGFECNGCASGAQADLASCLCTELCQPPSPRTERRFTHAAAGLRARGGCWSVHPEVPDVRRMYVKMPYGHRTGVRGDVRRGHRI